MTPLGTATAAQISELQETRCVFDDCPVAPKQFGEKVMPLMESQK